MVDVDGVLLIHPDAQGWSTHLGRDLGLERSALQTAFFEPHWDDVANGRASLRERLAPVLRTVAPHLSCDALISYWFERDTHLNRDLMAELDSSRKDGIEIHLATVQEHERARYLWEVLEFSSAFDCLHYSADLGFSKPDCRFFSCIEDRTGFAPHELLFIDDKPDNIVSAKSRGWNAAHWTGDEKLSSFMRSVC